MSTSQKDNEAAFELPFAILRPDDVPAKSAFDQVVATVFMKGPIEERQRLQHFIVIDSERTYDEEVAQFRDDSERGYLSDTPSEASPEAEKRQQQLEGKKIFTGAYVFSLANFPEGAHCWRAGRGRISRPADFVIATKDTDAPVRGIHAVFSFCQTTRLLKIDKGSHASMHLKVNGKAVTQPKTFVKKVTDVLIAGLGFTLEYTDYSKTDDYKLGRTRRLREVLDWTDQHSIVIEPTPEQGTTVVGEWNMQTPLGRGSGGTVAAAVNDTSKVVAIKTKSRGNTTDHRITIEIKTLQTLTGLANLHGERRLLRLHEIKYEYGDAQERSEILGNLYYVLKPYCHYTLHSFVTHLENTNAPEAPFIEYAKTWAAREVLKGLDFMHSHSWIHGDIKPTNIGVKFRDPVRTPQSNDEFLSVAWLTKCWRVVLIDLDSAKNVKDEPNQQLACRPGTGGTRGYIAPEREIQPWSFPADMWAFGVMFYTLLYGTPPWHAISENPWREGQKFEKWRPKWKLLFLKGLKKMKNRYDCLDEVLKGVFIFHVQSHPDNMSHGRSTAKEALSHFSWIAALGVEDSDEDEQRPSNNAMIEASKESSKETLTAGDVGKSK